MSWISWLSGLAAIGYLLRYVSQLRCQSPSVPPSASNSEAASTPAANTRAGTAAAAETQAEHSSAADSAAATTAARDAAATPAPADDAQVPSEPAGLTADVQTPQGPRTHTFELFGTDAQLSWTPGSDRVAVRCRTRFSKGKPDSSTEGVFHYSLRQKKWERAPRGAARDVAAVIEAVCAAD